MMNRRSFIKISAGAVAMIAVPSSLAVTAKKTKAISYKPEEVIVFMCGRRAYPCPEPEFSTFKGYTLLTELKMED